MSEMKIRNSTEVPPKWSNHLVGLKTSNHTGVILTRAKINEHIVLLVYVQKCRGKLCQEETEG